MLLERRKRNHLEGAFVGRGKHHRRRRPIAMSPQPVCRRDTPAIARNESWEPVLRHRGREIVADAALVVEELLGGYRTHGMTSGVLCSGVAPSIPMEAGKRVGAARLEFASKDVAIGHGTSIAESGGRRALVGSIAGRSSVHR